MDYFYFNFYYALASSSFSFPIHVASQQDPESGKRNMRGIQARHVRAGRWAEKSWKAGSAAARDMVGAGLVSDPVGP